MWSRHFTMSCHPTGHRQAENKTCVSQRHQAPRCPLKLGYRLEEGPRSGGLAHMNHDLTAYRTLPLLGSAHRAPLPPSPRARDDATGHTHANSQSVSLNSFGLRLGFTIFFCSDPPLFLGSSLSCCLILFMDMTLPLATYKFCRVIEPC